MAQSWAFFIKLKSYPFINLDGRKRGPMDYDPIEKGEMNGLPVAPNLHDYDKVTAGFRWAPETLPMNMMIAITIKPGATTAAVRVIVFGNA